MSEVKLTIGIPVYNGARFIQKTLDSILVQLIRENLKNQLQILISDNASEDNTSLIVHDYQNQYGTIISYYQNEKNVGFDKNVDLVVERASGKYVWLLGCGEIVKDDALKFILDKIDSNTYDNILLNFDSYSETKNEISVETNYIITRDQIYYSQDDFFIKTKFGILPLSANIVLKASWMRVSENELIVTGWVHVKRIIDILSYVEYKGTLQVGKLSFTLYRESDGWWTRNGNFLLNSLNLLKIINTMRENNAYKVKTIKILFNEIYKNLHKLIRRSKRCGLVVTFQVVKDTAILFYRRPAFWFFHLPFLLVPSIVYNNTIIKRISHLPRDAYRFIKIMVRRVTANKMAV